jgi:uncharacterized repeat protein (TIGR01451 family)
MKTNITLSLLFMLTCTTLSAQSVCTGDLFFTMQSQIDMFLINNPDCTTIDGYIYVDNTNPSSDINNLDAFSGLVQVNGLLKLFLDEQISLDGLSNIQQVGSLDIQTTVDIDISALSGLQIITGLCHLSGEGFVTTAPLDNITELGSLAITLIHCENLFPNLTSVASDVIIGEYSNWMDEFTGLDALTYIGGDLKISANFLFDLYITNFDGLHNLQTIGGNLVMESLECPSFSGLENVATIGGGELNMKLYTSSDYPHFDNLTSIGYVSLRGASPNAPNFSSLTLIPALEIAGSYGNLHLPSVQRINYFSACQSYAPATSLQWPNLDTIADFFFLCNSTFSDLSFLSEVSVMGGIVDIEGNCFLSDCEAQAICEKLAVDPQNVTIAYNAEGCNGIEEVSNSCAVNSVSGIVYLDMDCDGVFNNDDFPFNNPIMVNSDGLPFTQQSGSDGFYFIPLENNSTTSFIPQTMLPAAYQTVTTDETNITFVDYNFAICPDFSINDVEVSAYAYTHPVPGFTQYMFITVKNRALNFASGELVYDFSNMPGASLSAVQQGVISGSTVTFMFNDIAPFSSQNFFVGLETSATTILGTVQTPVITATLTGVIDNYPANNIYTFDMTVEGSYDPNMITVNKTAINADSLEAQEGDWLYYTILFQNVGTAPAQTVKVLNNLELDLDLSTIEMVGSSHSYDLVFDGRQVSWLFENIQLADSTSNEPASHGYIQYKIKYNPNLVTSDVIENSAAIYFDFNEPVITNVASTIFYTCPQPLTVSGTAEICEGDSTLLFASPGWDNYLWSIGVNSIGDQNSLMLENESDGDYSIECSATTEYCSETTTFMAIVNPIPDTPIISQNGNTLTASGSGTFTWFLNGNMLSESGNTIAISSGGLYSVQIEQNGCVSEMISETFNTIAVDELNSRNEFYIYPNPATSTLFIQIPYELQNCEISICNSLGQEFRHDYKTKRLTHQIDCSSFPRGLYIVRIGDKSMTFTLN